MSCSHPGTDRDVHGSDRIGSDRTLVGSDKNYRLSENRIEIENRNIGDTRVILNLLTFSFKK